MYYLKKSAVSGHVSSMTSLGLLLYSGYDSIGRDTTGAVAWFRAASELNDKYGHLLLANAYYDGRAGPGNEPDFAEAGRLYAIAMEQGVGEASYSLGLMYEYGLIRDAGGVQNEEPSPLYSSMPYPPNYPKAISLYKSAWDSHKVIEAGYNLALMEAYGRGTQQSPTKAMEIFKTLALEYAHPPSMRYLGIFNLHGYGMKQSDYDMAVLWFDKCARTATNDVGDKCKVERDEVKNLIDKAKLNIKKVQEMYVVDH